MESLINTNFDTFHYGRKKCGKEICKISNFKKLSKNVFSYLLQYCSYEAYPGLMMVNKFFVSNIEYFLKYKVNKDKNLLDFYGKHIFLFNENCLTLLKRTILPYINLNEFDEGLFFLLQNESLLIKQFIFSLEEEIENDLHLAKSLNSESNYLKMRQNVLVFISKLISQRIVRNSILELSLYESKIGIEGAMIVSYLIKFSKKIDTIDFSYSLLSDDDLRIILNLVDSIEGFFTMDLSGVDVSLTILKFMKIIEKDYKKKFILGNNQLVKKSKITADKNKRIGKQKTKK
jgi:hypothetical protein